MSQSLDSATEAVRSLLPLLNEHILLHPASRIVPPAQWVSEGELPPPRVPGPPCDGRCFGCRLEGCRDEGWVAKRDQLRRRYRALPHLESWLVVLADLPWGHQKATAIRYLYVEPCNVFAHPPWMGWAEEGVVWLAERCVEAGVYVRPFDPLRSRKRDRMERCATLWAKGMSVRRISQRTGVPKSTVHDWLAKRDLL